jgi:hypothetical protein
MSGSPLFKRAFVRGLNTELTRRGVALWPTKEAADSASDYIADTSGMPDPLENPNALTAKVAEDLCEKLVVASRYMCKEAGDRYQPALQKTAAETNPSKLAWDGALECMNKVAAEMGSMLQPGKDKNDLPAAAAVNAEAKQEQNRRPEGYANLGETGVGNYERKGEGSVGTEEKHPEAPAATGKGSNSATENTSKHGSLADVVRKVANEMGSMMRPGQEKNDLPAAAQHNAEARQELTRRPEGYAVKGEDGVGRSDMVPPTGAQIGVEQAHPEAPVATDKGKTNVPLEHLSKSAFDVLFEETAKDVVPYLPEKMAEETKIAHVRATMGLDTSGRASYLHDLYATLGAEKTAAELVRDHYTKTAAAKVQPAPAPAKTAAELPPAVRSETAPAAPAKVASDNSLSNLRAALGNLNR